MKRNGKYQRYALRKRFPLKEMYHQHMQNKGNSDQRFSVLQS